MKLAPVASRLAIGLSAFSGLVWAFPTPENLAKLGLGQDIASPEEFHEQLLQLKERSLLGLDALSTPIDVHGKHEFKEPNFEKGDQRGPCPGLNALANHGYIPRSGVVGSLEAITAVNQVFGMGVDLATVLSIMATVGVGNPLSLKPGFSIGGKSSKSSNLLGNLLGLLGTPRGLDGSHNWIEGDSSNTREDLYVSGDASTMSMDLWMEVYKSIGSKGYLSMDDLGNRAAQRLKDSIATNPILYYGPYTGFVARNAGFMFAGRLLSNHSKEYPFGGHLTKDVLMSFWGVYETGKGKLEYKKGCERIPENWYRYSGEYGLVPMNVDLLAWATKHPSLASIGGNMGEVNTFTGVDLSDISGGVLNAPKLLEGNNLLCFSLEAVKTFSPNSLSSIFKTLGKPLKLVTDALVAPILDLSCPAFKELEKGGEDVFGNLLDKFPGAKKSGSAL